MPVITIDLSFLLLAISVAGILGYEVGTWHQEAEQEKVLQTQVAATAQAEKHANDISTEFENANRAATESQSQLMEKWRIADAKPHAICLLSDDSIKLLKSASSSKNNLPR
jgi:hypothetical protein